MGVLPEIFSRAVPIGDEGVADVLSLPKSAGTTIHPRESVAMSAIDQIVRTPLETYGPFNVFHVDGEQVRQSAPACADFTHWGIGSWWPNLIPSNEIWLDRSCEWSEACFHLTNALTQLQALRQGYSPSEAVQLGNHQEAAERDKQSPATFTQASQVAKTLMAHLPGPVTVYRVDGDEVEDATGATFSSEGHSATCGAIPTDEIWIDSSLDETDANFAVLHAYAEHVLMKDGVNDAMAAHRLATHIEFDQRMRGDVDLYLLRPSWIRSEAAKYSIA